MDKIDLPFFYKLGVTLNKLTELGIDNINEIDILLTNVEIDDMINELFKRYKSLNVCKKSGEELLKKLLVVNKATGEMFVSGTEQEKNSSFIKLQQTYRDAISQAKQFETVLLAELQTMAVYQASKKGIYSTTDLIERAENILPESALEKISDRIKDEINESGKCLAFDNNTASAFHMMRATEGVLHDYYIAVCKPYPRPLKMLTSWGAYLNKLKEITEAEVKEVVAMIQQIKDLHRNLIMHPEIVLTNEEAFTLFEIAQGAIIAMTQRIPKVN